MFAGWHNTEIIAVPPLLRPSVYVSVSEWWSRLEPTNLIKVPTLPVFRYYSDRIIHGTSIQSDEIWRIARSEFYVVVVMCFLATSRDGVKISKTRDLRIR